MKVSDIGPLLLAGAMGIGLGLLFFGGLWLTVRQLARTRHAAVLAMLSFWVRLAASLAVFVWVAKSGRWERLLACFVGFLLVRILLVRRWRPDSAQRRRAAGGG